MSKSSQQKNAGQFKNTHNSIRQQSSGDISNSTESALRTDLNRMYLHVEDTLSAVEKQAKHVERLNNYAYFGFAFLLVAVISIAVSVVVFHIQMTNELNQQNLMLLQSIAENRK